MGFPALVFLSGLIYFCLRILGFGLEYIPGDLGDSRFINFLLEHGHQWISGKETSFWNAGFMYPFQNSIALSDNMLGSLPLYSVWRFAGFDIETAYQLWWLTVCTLNFWICYLVLRKWNQPVLLAAVLAWLFAFSIFNIGQLNYMQMIVRFMVPVAFYAAFRMVSTPSRKYLLLYLFAIAAQLYLVMYTGIYLLYFSLLFIAVYAFMAKKFDHLKFYFRKEQLLFTGIASLAFLVLIGLLLLPYHEMSKTVGLRLYREVAPNLPALCSYLLPHESSVPWNFLSAPMQRGLGEYWLHYLFPGIILFVTLLAAPIHLAYTRYKRVQVKPEIKALLLCIFLIALLHIHWGNGISLYAAIFKLPGMNSIRVPVRFMHVELFLLVVALGYFLRNLRPALVLPLFLLVFADNLFIATSIPRTQKKDLTARREILRNTIVKQNSSSKKILAVTDTSQAAYITHLDAMLAAQSLGMKTINGYSSYCPDSFDEFFTRCNNQGLDKWLAYSNISREEVLIIDRNTGSSGH
ncbi:MAG: hypothetical protein IM638_01105 [Bacteroidetes bacterium]|nr:hypothetical protein [Bacteroidota bacterium]